MMPTRLLLIRHGETTSSAADRFSGEENVLLSDQGRQQVEQLALRLAREEVSAVYSSPSDRTVATSGILAQPHGLTPITLSGLREISTGHWEGLTYAEVQSRFPKELDAWQADPLTYAPEGGEPGISVLARALPAFRQILIDHDGDSVMVVSHSGTLRLFISSALSLDPRDYRRHLVLAPASLSILEFTDPARGQLVLYNDISHYGNHP